MLAFARRVCQRRVHARHANANARGANGRGEGCPLEQGKFGCSRDRAGRERPPAGKILRLQRAKLHLI